jgi:hypothetical protein
MLAQRELIRDERRTGASVPSPDAMVTDVMCPAVMSQILVCALLRCVMIYDMSYRRRGNSKGSVVNDGNRRDIIQILSLEYQILREETVLRTTGRFQFLGLMTTAAALLTTGIFGSSSFKNQTWIAASLALLVFLFGVVCFVYLGRQRGVALMQVAALEKRINALVQAEPGYSMILSLERNRVHWTFCGKIKLLLFGGRAR